MRNAILLMVGLFVVCVVAAGRPAAPEYGRVLPPNALAQIRGANPATKGDWVNNGCALSTGLNVTCASPSYGQPCVICEFDFSGFEVASAGGSTNLQNPTPNNCNGPGYKGTCGWTACNTPLNPNYQCTGNVNSYNTQL